ncbi:MAG TPA: hypothetical protein VGM06_03810 [Polyangiaceae bacterium]|jgi:hypothetical protein
MLSIGWPTRVRSFNEGGDRRFAAWVLLAYLPLAVFSIVHHEMWRDELHCWLVARDSATPWDVVRNRAYDGHPPLWYLLLWVLEKATHDPRSMQIVHVAIAAACVWVFAAFAPFGRSVRALFPFGYFMAYEYVAISRCYGLALLFALLLCVHHPRRAERPLVTSVLVAALALTTTVATMVAAGYLVTLVLDWLGATRAGREHRNGLLWPIAVGGLACLAALACAWPPADSTVAHVALPKTIPSDDAPTRLIAGLLPIPRPDFFFWNSNALLSYEPFRAVALWVSLALAAWIVFLLSVDHTAAIVFAAGSLLLVALFGGVYGGDVRHHGFFFVLFLMGAWIARASSRGASRTKVPLREAALAPTLAVVLLVHVPAAAIALSFDYRYVFSSGARAASAIRAHGLADALLVAEVDYPAITVLGLLGPHAFAYSPRTGRPFSFVKWTRDRHWDPTDEQTVDYAAGLGQERGEDAVLIMNRPLAPNIADAPGITRIAELYDSMIEEENYYLYRVARRTVGGACDPRFAKACGL